MEKKLEKIADILINYSVVLKKGEKIILAIKDLEALPLFYKVYAKVLEKGAFPITVISTREVEKIFFDKASKQQLEFVPVGHEINIKSADAAINFSGLGPSNYLTGADHKKINKRALITKKLDDYFVNNVRWLLTGFPTMEVIEASGLSKTKFLKIYFNAILQNWKKVKKDLEKIKKVFDNAEEVIILGERTDLSLSLRNRKGVVCAGNMNMPDGEVFYSPRETSIDGEIFFEFPQSYHGHNIEGAHLKFREGKVASFGAKVGKSSLGNILKTDKGAKFVGELGIGANFGIKDYINNTLFDEKIGGTIHLALGQSYKESGGKNFSAIHFDMVKDLRKNGEVWVDGKLVFQNGKFKKL